MSEIVRESSKLIVFNLSQHVLKALVLYRSPSDKSRPGEFDFPGGGLEPGETPGRAMRREAKEEAGMYIGRTLILPVISSRDVGRSGNHTHIRHLYMALVHEELPVFTSHEHSGYDWLPSDEVFAGLTHPVHKILFQSACKLVSDIPPTPPFETANQPHGLPSFTFAA